MLFEKNKKRTGGQKQSKATNPTKTIALAFAGIIVLGALLLTLPVSSRSGISCGFLPALFTATSATCVTGLVLFDTWTQWSLFGQIVILCMIEIGGLGFMSAASVVFPECLPSGTPRPYPSSPMAALKCVSMPKSGRTHGGCPVLALKHRCRMPTQPSRITAVALWKTTAICTMPPPWVSTKSRPLSNMCPMFALRSMAIIPM